MVCQEFSLLLSLLLATSYGSIYEPELPLNTTTGSTAIPVAQEERKSPCPQSFQYGVGDKPGELSATLVAFTPHELHGVWIKLIFDRELEELTVQNGYEVKPSEDRKEFLIKNRNVLLRGGRREILKIAAKYDGDKLPNLMEYRLNAVTICPDPRTKRTDFYLGDLEYSKTKFVDFLSLLTSTSSKSEPAFQCASASTDGTKPLYPWQAALYLASNGVDADKYVCEATLISTRHLLTPAHCVTFFKTKLQLPSERLLVYFGKFNSSEVGARRAVVSEILLYPGYVSTNFLNDLAVLQLATPVEVSDEIRPICLPETGREKNEVADLVGYTLRDGVFKELQAKEVRRVKSCKELVESIGIKGLGEFEGDNNYCITYSKEDDVCVGDSGSSVVALGADKKWYLDGFVSLGTGIFQQKCTASTPVVVTDTSRYSYWLKNVIY